MSVHSFVCCVRCRLSVSLKFLCRNCKKVLPLGLPRGWSTTVFYYSDELYNWKIFDLRRLIVCLYGIEASLI